MTKSARAHTRNGLNSSDKAALIHLLEQKFATINELLYTTSVSCDELEEKVLPYIADDVVFKDPWQEGGDKKLYGIGMKGFHNMLNFTFDTYQVGVRLNDDSATGRCIVDGMMNLRQFSWIYTFPLRTVIIYDFRLLDSPTLDGPQFEIFHQEEMWSYADMIDGIPGVSWVYTNLFRPAFGHLFVGVSYLSCVVKDFLADMSKKRHPE